MKIGEFDNKVKELIAAGNNKVLTENEEAVKKDGEKITDANRSNAIDGAAMIFLALVSMAEKCGINLQALAERAIIIASEQDTPAPTEHTNLS